MVIKAYNNDEAPVRPTSADGLSMVELKSGAALASPLDRMAAAVIDYCILLPPIIYLVVAPFQRMAKEGAIFNSHNKIAMAMGLGFFVVMVLVLAYQTICVWIWGATPGKALLSLQVQSLLSDQKIKLTQSLTRGFFWLLSWGLFGIPFAATLSNILRRPLHDRISDSIVVTKRRERAVCVPSKNEMALARSAYLALSAFITVLVATSVIQSVSEWESGSEQIATLESENLLCPEISQAQKEWPQEKTKTATRLSVAMALFAAGSVDRDCLQNEVEYLFLTGEESPLMYLAKGFVYSDQPELSEEYLEKVCELDHESIECKMSLIVTDIADDNWSEASQKFSAAVENDPVYFKIWAVRQYLDRNEFAKAEKVAELIPALKPLSDFTVPSQIKIFWGLHREDEVRGFVATAYSGLNNNAKLDITSFICFEEIWASCNGVKSQSCGQIDDLLTKVEDGLASVKISLAYLRKWECEKEEVGQKKDYRALEGLSLHPDVQALVSSISQNDLEELRELLKDESLNDDLTGEIFRRLLSRLKSAGSVKVLAEHWMKERDTLGWVKTGETLFSKYFEMKLYEDGLRVADEILDRVQYLSKNMLEKSVVAALRVGQSTRARKLMSIYAEKHPLPELWGHDRQSGTAYARSPASESEFINSVIQLQRGGE